MTRVQVTTVEIEVLISRMRNLQERAKHTDGPIPTLHDLLQGYIEQLTEWQARTPVKAPHDPDCAIRFGKDCCSCGLALAPNSW